jgi:dephospho-CoA kinase
VSAAVPFVGLTGGMGAGKSTALSALRELGAEVISSDEVVHELYESPEVVAALSERFGSEVAADGSVDRPELARRAFASAEGRAWLEALVWPLVGRRIVEWLEQARALDPPPRAAVVEVPLLFEAGLEDGYDATIAVLADEGLRRSRAAARGQVLLAERDARQLDQQEKAARATFVVHNDGTEQDLARQLSEVLDKLERR